MEEDEPQSSCSLGYDRVEYCCLQFVELPSQIYEIEHDVRFSKCRLALLREILTCQHSGVRCLRFVIDSLNLTPLAHLLFELHHRYEEVDVVVHGGVETIEQVQLFGGIVAVVANCTPDNGPVLLLDVGVVILLARPSAGERDLFAVAVPQELVVDELRAVI